ncbi:DNA topoisomerase IB [Actinoplanes couchii]|uniref:DNA topoisomerase n=1 Tax=Actinoplanes couchii TaxID=403638 RepID=A0ABQ3XD11_9ACTN|nr:DNA topoisomerase IB [Actinoplanes couchii]MDR6321172.1 DNA topoisomerase IB [Actinoplanes couchii]GID56280.1 DNA topoisomerase [Actinoplanes couchii]
MRLRRSDPAKPGLTRNGRRVVDAAGEPVRDRETLDRIAALVIPPAWRQVWIAPDPRGHIQAVGVDAAGRKQYLYHPVWREQQDRAKFDRVLELAERLPEVRDRLDTDLTGRGLTRSRVLAAVVGLLDMGMFRMGGAESAARDEDPSYGLSTLRPEHVRIRGAVAVLEFVGKSGVEHEVDVVHLEICAVLRGLKRRRRGADRLFAHWDPSARRWQPVHAGTINEYLREISGEDMTAKDFRTWHGTVRAAVALADAGPQPTPAKRRKAVAEAMREAATLLGNTPAVARGSYVDPRVVEAYEQGDVATHEAEVRALLNDGPT